MLKFQNFHMSFSKNHHDQMTSFCDKILDYCYVKIASLPRYWNKILNYYHDKHQITSFCGYLETILDNNHHGQLQIASFCFFCDKVLLDVAIMLGIFSTTCCKGFRRIVDNLYRYVGIFCLFTYYLSRYDVRITLRCLKMCALFYHI